MEYIISVLALIIYAWSLIAKNRDKDEKYEYPEIPDQAPADVKLPPAGARPPRSRQPAAVKAPPATDIVLPPAASAFAAKPAAPAGEHTAPPLAAPADVTDGLSPWTGALNENLVVNGIIFAEIIQPPRSKRPMLRGGRRVI